MLGDSKHQQIQRRTSRQLWAAGRVGVTVRIWVLIQQGSNLGHADLEVNESVNHKKKVP